MANNNRSSCSSVIFGGLLVAGFIFIGLPLMNKNADENNNVNTSQTQNVTTNTTQELEKLGFIQDEITVIDDLLNQIGITKIVIVKEGAGQGIDVLQSYIALANGEQDETFILTFEERKLYYVGFLNNDLYNSDEGGVLMSYKDVHIPETKVGSEWATIVTLAEINVEKYLSFPKTANYNSEDVKREDNYYIVTGNVVCKNAFGVEIEQHYRYEAKRVGEEEYDPQYLSIGEDLFFISDEYKVKNGLN